MKTSEEIGVTYLLSNNSLTQSFLCYLSFMHIHKNIHLNGSRGKPMLTDLFFTEGKSKPVVIYSHGFNGFKDWGNFDLIAKQFASAGFVIIKFNFSHNGTTIDAPEDFKDLNAFAENNYTKELDDLNYVIDWLYGDEFFLRM